MYAYFYTKGLHTWIQDVNVNTQVYVFVPNRLHNAVDDFVDANEIQLSGPDVGEAAAMVIVEVVRAVGEHRVRAEMHVGMVR